MRRSDWVMKFLGSFNNFTYNKLEVMAMFYVADSLFEQYSIPIDFVLNNIYIFMDDNPEESLEDHLMRWLEHNREYYEDLLLDDVETIS